MKVAFITGSSGFVGSNLVTYLVEQNSQIVLLSSSQQFDPSVESFANVFYLPRHPNSAYLHDIVHSISLISHPYCLNYSFDISPNSEFFFFFCSGCAHLPSSSQLRNSSIYYTINSVQPALLYSQASSLSFVSFTYLSSISILQQTDSFEISPFTPKSSSTVYSDSKILAESLLVQINTSSQTRLIILRPPLIYGPGVKGNMKLLLKILSLPIPFPVFQPYVCRSFLGISHLVTQMLYLSLHSTDHCYVSNISDPHPANLFQFFNTISFFFHKKSFVIDISPFLGFLHPLFLLLPPYRKIFSPIILTSSDQSNSLSLTSPSFSEKDVFFMVQYYIDSV